MAPISRREFIRLASLMGGVSLFAGCSLFGERSPVPDYIKGAPSVDPVETLKGVQSVYSVCGLCPGNCGICCRVAEGTVVKIGGNPYSPIASAAPLSFDLPVDKALASGASICAIGGSGIQTLYDPFRVVRPLKRVGERGSGQWTAVSWEQAYTEIIEGGDLFGEGPVVGISRAKEAREGLRLLIGRVDWGAATFMRRFVGAFPSASVMYDREAHLAELGKAASEAVFGPGMGPVGPDYDKARVVVSFGDAPLDSGVPLVSVGRQIASARVDGQGMKWAVVDPRLSTSASRADLWFPIRPGTDMALVLAVIRSLLEHHPSLAGLLSKPLRDRAMSRSVADHAADCGLAAGEPARLADMLLDGRERLAVIPGRGVFGQPDGLQTASAILTLNVMMGSVPGSGGLIVREEPFLADAEQKISAGLAPRDSSQYVAASARAMLLWSADPVYDDPIGTAALLRDRKEIPLLIAVDNQVTESSALADYILPDTTYLERWDICLFPSTISAAGAGIRKPAVGAFDQATKKYYPIFPDTRPMEEILAGLATRLGLPGFGPKAFSDGADLVTAWDYYGRLIPTVLESMRNAGLPVDGSRESVEKVIARGGFFAAPDKYSAVRPRTSMSVQPWEPYGPQTRTPVSEDPDDEFQLITYTQPFHRRPHSGINSWLLEVMPENRLLINRQDARRLRIGMNDKVVVTSADHRIRIECKAQLMAGIRPGVVALAAGFGYRQAGAAPSTVDGVYSPADRTRAAGINPEVLLAAGCTVSVRRTG